MPKKPEPPILKALDELYKKHRIGNKPAAVKRVAELTGAGLRMSKDFVDGLQ